jgi:hypothetical protein
LDMGSIHILEKASSPVGKHILSLDNNSNLLYL